MRLPARGAGSDFQNSTATRPSQGSPGARDRAARARSAWNRSTAASMTARSVIPAGSSCAGEARDERLEALEALLVQAPQFDEGLGMVVHAKVERRVALGRMDDQRRRLLAALVAAGRLAGFHRDDEPHGERQRAAASNAAAVSSSTRGPASMLPASE